MNCLVVACVEDVNLQTECVCRRLNVSRLNLESRIVRVQEHRDQCSSRNQFAQKSEAFSPHHGNEKAGPCCVPAGPIKAGDEAKPDWVVAGNEDDRYRRCRRLGREPGVDAPGRRNDGHLTANQIGRQRRQSIVLTLRPAVIDRRILTFDVTAFLEALVEYFNRIGGLGGRPAAQEPDHRHRRLLRARRERPRRSATNERNELAPFHSITSSASASNLSGIIKPSAFAVLKSSRQLGDELMPFWL